MGIWLYRLYLSRYERCLTAEKEGGVVVAFGSWFTGSHHWVVARLGEDELPRDPVIRTGIRGEMRVI